MTDPTAPKDIDEALLILQANPPRLVKDQDGQVGSQRTKYADLSQAHEVILPRLCALGVLWWTAPTLRLMKGQNGQEDPRFVLDWELKHLASDTKRAGSYPLVAGTTPMQGGSAITYARRYALVAVTNAVAEDDDDDAGAGTARRARAPRPARQSGASTPPATRAAATEPPPLPNEAPAPPLATTGHEGPSPKQLGMMRAQLAKMDVTDPGDVYALLGDMVKRPLRSTKELTKAEASGLIDAMVEANEKYGERALLVLPDLYGGPRRGRRTQARPPATESRTAAQQTRDAVLGQPAGPDDEAPPWETEPPPDDPWPTTATPGAGR